MKSRISMNGLPSIRSTRHVIGRAILEAVESRRLMAATLDPSFANGGVAEFGDGSEYSNATSVTLPEGKVLTVSQSLYGYSQFALHRLNADGTNDESFGTDGLVNIDIGSGPSDALFASAVTAAPDGSFYLAGRYDDPNQDFDSALVAHINADGSLDTTFGGDAGVNGLVFLNASSLSPTPVSADAPHLAVDADGSLFVGYTLNSANDTAQVAVTKLTAQGEVVDEFSNGGTSVDTIPGTGGNLGRLFVRGSSILLVGSTYATPVEDPTSPGTFLRTDASVFTAVLDADGNLTNAGDPGTDAHPDDGFGMTFINADGNRFDVDGVAITPDGGLAVGGNLYQGQTPTALKIARLDANYAAVAGFGDNGVATVVVPDHDLAFWDADDFNDRVSVDAAGNVYGVTTDTIDPDNAQYDIAVVRLDASGQLDPTFDDDGLFTYSRTDVDNGMSIVPALDGGQYVTGYSIGFDAAPADIVLKLAGAVAPPVNHAPTVATVSGPATSPETNQPATFTATFADVDDGDSLQVAWNFGDGVTQDFAPAAQPTASASHAYTAPGTYTVTFAVKDAAGATATGTTTVTVVTPPPPAPYTLVNGQLAYTGTNAADTVALTKNSAGQAVLTINGTPYTISGTVSSVVLNGGAGNDLIKVSTAFTIPTTLIGGDGNDTLRGGSGSDVLLGDAGNDTLIGRNGRDLEVGGVGADLLIGNEQDDILISGTTSYASTNFTAWNAIMAEWTSNRSFAARVINLVLPVPLLPHANGNYYLTPFINVFDDTSVDTVVGGGGDDLPLVTIVGTRDVVNDGQTSFAANILALINGD